MHRAKLLREFFAKEGIIRLAGAHDGLTARLIERAGFEGIWASGFEISTAHAVPDANILTMTDFLRAATIMNDAVSIPVVVDADTGYGNSNNVIHMVKKFEAAGIAAVCIEDKHFPKMNSFIPGRQELASIAEFVGKIVAAKNAQTNEDFMVFARVEALIAGWGLEEALKRAYAYVEAGADGIFIHSKSKNPSEIINFIDSWESAVPLVVCPTTYPRFNLQEAKKSGKVKVYIFANHGIRSKIKAISENFEILNKTGDIRSLDGKIATMEEVFALQGMLQLKENEQRYLRKSDEVVAIIPAAADTKKGVLKEILQDTPLTLLDINGKSILQRNTEILNRLGINETYIITGAGADKMDIEGVKFIHNKDYNQTYILHSIMCALEKISKKTLLVYSDILFEREIIEKLLESTADITLVIDASYKSSRIRSLKKEEEDLVLVKAQYEPLEARRVLRTKRDNSILNIGKKIDPRQATHEYIGIALFSPKGIADFKNVYYQERAGYKTGSFNEASNFNMANFHDLLMKMIEKGHRVNALEIDKGWTEVHTFDDYKNVCKMLAE